MPRTSDFYSVNEINKPLEKRVYHNNSSCPPGREITAAGEDRLGKSDYRLCRDCDERNGPGR